LEYQAVKYLVKRLILMIPVLVGSSLIVFMILQLIPGDPIQVIFAGTGASLEQREAMRHSLGLDRPLPLQFVNYLWNAMHGDFGQSIHFNQPVLQLILERMPATIELTLAGLFIGLIFAFPAGIISSTKRNSIVDYIVMVCATLGISLPTFWVGILMIMLVAVNLGLLPGFGRIEYGNHLSRVTGFYLVDSLITGNIPAFKDALAHLILPAVTLGLSVATYTARMVRSSTLEELGKEYVRTARAKGLPEGKVIRHHVVRNALIPVITLIGVWLGDLLGGAVVTETIFAWPGIGRLVIQAINARDYPVVQGVVLFFALIRITINFLTDIIYVWVDPRIGHI
jgi:ABC-type dipeptide/oligopeptide/nickel transport system permease component